MPRIFGFKLHPTAYGNRETAPARNQNRIAAPKDNAAPKDGQQQQQKQQGEEDESL